MMQTTGFLAYRNYRYLKVAALLTVAALLAYWFARPVGGAAYGGTWFGYVLGIASALIVLIHLWYGVRKRRPPRAPERRWTERRKLESGAEQDAAGARKHERRTHSAKDDWRFGASLQGWLSAHVYLGVALLVLTSLHSGWRLGWNVHTLAYVLVLLVVASGLYGVHAYVRYPRLITQNSGEDAIGDVLLRIAELDELARLRALGLPDEVNTLVWRARTETRLGGSFLEQLGGGQDYCPTDLAVARVRELGKVLVDGDQPALMRDLYAVLVQKQHLVEQARNEIRLNARMRFWLYLHAPLSIALLAALLAHVLSILIYW